MQSDDTIKKEYDISDIDKITDSKDQPTPKPEGEVLKPDFLFEGEKVTHSWHQEGYYLVCRCLVEHGSYIGPDKIMVGVTKEGMPIVENRQA